jgi:hypothetical protein
MGITGIDARAGFDEPARKVHTIVMRGVEGLGQYFQLSGATASQIETAFRPSAASAPPARSKRRYSGTAVSGTRIQLLRSHGAPA